MGIYACHPFNTGYPPLSYSGNPGVFVSHGEGWACRACSRLPDSPAARLVPQTGCADTCLSPLPVEHSICIQGAYTGCNVLESVYRTNLVPHWGAGSNFRHSPPARYATCPQCSVLTGKAAVRLDHGGFAEIAGAGMPQAPSLPDAHCMATLAARVLCASRHLTQTHCR